MENPVSDDVARGRWLALNAIRMAGVAMVLVGILAVQDVFEFPSFAGWFLIGIGLVDIFVVPQIMARKWRSPLE